MLLEALLPDMLCCGFASEAKFSSVTRRGTDGQAAGNFWPIICDANDSQDLEANVTYRNKLYFQLEGVL